LRILAKVKFNEGIALVLDRAPILEYTKVGRSLYGTDGLFYQCYQFERPAPGWKAFAGREFDITLKNGKVIHCNGQWWEGGYEKLEKLLDITLSLATYRSIDGLKNCFVFGGSCADATQYEAFVNSFEGPLYGYHEYEKMLKRGGTLI